MKAALHLIRTLGRQRATSEAMRAQARQLTPTQQRALAYAAGAARLSENIAALRAADNRR